MKRFSDYPTEAEREAARQSAKSKKPIRRVTANWLIKASPLHRSSYSAKYIKKVIASNGDGSIQLMSEEKRVFALKVRKLIRKGVTEAVELAKALSMNPVSFYHILRSCGMFLTTKPRGSKRVIVEDTYEPI